jgi:hypothetical protein
MKKSLIDLLPAALILMTGIAYVEARESYSIYESLLMSSPILGVAIAIIVSNRFPQLGRALEKNIGKSKAINGI